VQKKLEEVTDLNELQVIDGLVPGMRAVAQRNTSLDEVVNALTDVYCGTLKPRKLTDAERGEKLGNFTMLTYSQLNSSGRE
jgi:hypothetical protein